MSKNFDVVTYDPEAQPKWAASEYMNKADAITYAEAFCSAPGTSATVRRYKPYYGAVLQYWRTQAGIESRDIS